MQTKSVVAAAAMMLSAIGGLAQTGTEPAFQKWALTPPMGWNSWDCYGPTVVESEVKANADYMATNLLDHGWEYVVVDIRWYVENDKAGGYNQTNPIYVIDEFGRYTPALNRFPSTADGVGFKALADYVHARGLKFGIHLMRGIPKEAVAAKLPVRGTDGITCDMIANNDSTCTWLRDNWKVDWRKPGAQQYYNSCFEMYADWGVDFVKIDDLARPYHTAEIEMIRNAIDNCGRPMVLSISPGETPVEQVEHVRSHANMWRTVDDFWDNWSQLNYQFQICAKWAPYIAPGTWPDADMLPLGKISIRGERGSERWTAFTPDEQRTMMSLWTIFKSPLMFGGDLPQNDAATNALLTNDDVLYMHSYSANNRQVSRNDDSGLVVWAADDPANGDKFVALFNIGGSQFVSTKKALYRSGTISYLTTGHCTEVDVALPEGTTRVALVVTDGGDSFDSDHADWIAPRITMADGSEVDLTSLQYVKGTCGWGDIHINSNLNGGKLSVDGVQYDKGIATHANSVIVYDLPGTATRFTALAGIDNTGSDQGSKSSVEFLVYNFDPTDPSLPVEDPQIEAYINLSDIGISSGVECRITDMWATKDMGTWKDATFSTVLPEHASALYRVTPLGRTSAPSVALGIGNGRKNSGEPFGIDVTVGGTDFTGAYVQILCNGKIVGTIPVDKSGKARYTATLPGGDYIFSARYSGTDKTASAISSESTVHVDGAAEDLGPLQKRLLTLLASASAIDPAKVSMAYREALASAITAAQPVESKNREELGSAIIQLQDALDNATLSIFYTNKLQTVMAECAEFSGQIKDGAPKNELLQAIDKAKNLVDSAQATIAAVKEEIEALSAVLEKVRLEAEPADGSEIDVTAKIVNPSFENGTTGWRYSNDYSGWQDVATWSDRPAADGSMFVSVAAGVIRSLNLYQDINKLPGGIYRLEASLRNTDSPDHITDQHLYATTGDTTIDSAPLTTVSGDGNNDWTRLEIKDIQVADGGTLRIGVKSTGDGTTNHGWFQADDFRLYYKGTSGIGVVPSAADSLAISTDGCFIVINSDSRRNLTLYAVDGRAVAQINAPAGLSRHQAAPGFYILAGHKILLH